jgi:diketogulonate reductase-like aldo/keto reductase
MPRLTLNACPNTLSWLNAGGRSMNCALDYGVNYVDLLLLHFTCDRWEDALQAWRVLEAAALSGRARAIGVSNFNRTDIDRLVTAAHIPPAANQAGFAIGSPQNATLGRDSRAPSSGAKS